MIRLYLDLCCFNRPFDDQGQTRVRLETDAKLELQAHVGSRQVELIWSYVLDYENAQNPFAERRESIARWRGVAWQVTAFRKPRPHDCSRDNWWTRASSLTTPCMPRAPWRARRPCSFQPTMHCSSA